MAKFYQIIKSTTSGCRKRSDECIKKSASESNDKREYGCHLHHHQMLLRRSNRWFAQRYNANNAWNFNGNNRYLNNNNVTNSNQVGAVANLSVKFLRENGFDY
jgi:hypothetical protein